MQNKNCLCSWSGGKDSCFALIQAIHQNYIPKVLLNVLNEEGKISRSHGIPSKILQAQAKAANIPIHLISSSWNDYEKKFTQALTSLQKQYDLTTAVFGDIDLQEHRNWEETVCTNANLTSILPLWKLDRRNLVMQMLNAGIKTMIVSCNEIMGEKFLGKMLTTQLITELENLGIDACGENGEYHTLVLNCSLFSKPIAVDVTDKILHNNYWFTALKLKE
ncbi:MAG: diphthine--ammonia ligase [Bacteroidetes bacterium]|nr:diphthine--ammonia ligase [Bacteroidota bacterium]MBS1648621.1 diphthine--ammonia ligase [Bacteroidota bacterium]